MAKSGKHLVGYGDGFWGPEHYPVKFNYADPFGFLIGQCAMNAIASWEDYYYEGTTEVKGWGAPFVSEQDGTKINNGVGSVLTGPFSIPYDNHIRLAPKDNNKVGVTRGIKLNVLPSSMLNWHTADFSIHLQWQGPPYRYSSEPSNSYSWTYSTNGGAPFVPGHVKWMGVQGELGDYPVDITLDIGPSTANTIGVDWPFVCSQGNYNAASTYFLPDPIDGIPYNHTESFAPSGFEHMYGDGVYLDNRLVAKAPVADNRLLKCTVDGEQNAVGQRGMVQGGAIRYLAPLYDYYLATDRLEEYNQKVENGDTDAWIVVVTHEWYLHNATMKNIAYIADRVYTIPMWLLPSGSVATAELADGATLSNLSVLIAESTGETKAQAIADYDKEYGKWRLLGTNEPAVSGDYPANVQDWQAWHMSRRVYHNNGESYSWEPWLFNQSGNKAIQTTYWRDSSFETLNPEYNYPIIKNISIGVGPFGTVTFGYEHGISAADASLFYRVVFENNPLPDPSYYSGTALLAADFKGDTLVEATVEVDNNTELGYLTHNETLNLPWAPIFGKYSSGANALEDTLEAITIGALDLRYDFMVYSKGTDSVDINNAHTTIRGDYFVRNTSIPTEIGQEYGPTDETGLFSGPFSVDSDSRATLVAFGSSVRFLRSNTYVMVHELGKGGFWDLSNYNAVNYLTPSEAAGTYNELTVVSSRYLYSKIVVNGNDLGSIEDVAVHYYPYANSGAINYTVDLG